MPPQSSAHNHQSEMLELGLPPASRFELEKNVSHYGRPFATSLLVTACYHKHYKLQPSCRTHCLRHPQLLAWNRFRTHRNSRE